MKKILIAVSLLLFLSGCIPDNILVPNEGDKTHVDRPNFVRIAAFNIKKFGQPKCDDEEAMEILAKIAREFDIMLVQEITDVSGSATQVYLQKINEMDGDRYAFICSSRLGRGTYKEAYAYFYNTSTVEFIDGSDYVYEDIDDVFEREPYIASFRCGNFDFTLVGIHVDPDYAVSEIDGLAKVVPSVLDSNPYEDDVIVLGDFNADCNYFKETGACQFRDGYHWLITDDMDTNVSTKRDCTYDRIVITDPTLHEYVYGSADVFYFDVKYRLDNRELVRRVSDHYPVYGWFNTGLDDDD